MKILQICAYAAPYEGNFMKSLFALEKSMSEKGYETVYAFPEQAASHPWVERLSSTHKVYFLPIAKSSFRRKTYSIIKQIFRENKDIKIAHSHFECYDVPLNIVAPKSVKVFWHLHDPIEMGSGLRKMLRRLHYGVFSRNVKLLSVAEKYRKDVVSIGFKESNTCTILNGIDLNRIDDCTACEKTFDFLTFGWDYYRKGVDIILDACGILSKEGVDYRIIVNGNDSTMSQMNQRYPDGIPSNIVFFGFCEDINVMLRQSNVFIQASRAETFSYSVAEAAYAGLNVLSSEIPGLEWAHELPTVQFFETENAEALASMMKESLSQNINANAIGESRRIIEEKYSVDCWVNNIKNSYFN